jgi:CRISPR/Cas system-associated endonuclease Cas1
MDTEAAERAAAPARFQRRVTFFEEPEIAERMDQRARDAGRSMSAEYRAAARYWLACFEAGDDE